MKFTEEEIKAAEEWSNKGFASYKAQESRLKDPKLNPYANRLQRKKSIRMED